MHFIDQFREACFGVRRTLEPQQQMIEAQTVIHGSTIIGRSKRVRRSVSRECNQLGFVNRSGDQRLRTLGQSDD